MDKIGQVINRFIRILIQTYQWCISPLFGPCCRYYPSCSEYAKLAIATHGCFRGLLLAIGRLSRCHPFAKGGIDLVPPPRK